ncbi:IS4 family transposase [Salinibacter ruber]|uniref:Transposase IS4-like domain-containing protein n=2 Tax=Salinibacter ruber TaxID=146919 RepID=A0A9X2UNG8_9BACT|nr:IS4 family transposase [Salinibacter ruber]MBB4090873.1 hypothetical protein [Salinibacter ruber]MCS3613287.1 hypothetical protein [Salinibacter ruber]MCS3616971.1 hypothetical protein [Salinibacter ruber]MCS3675835.1 hypothetical protein [Salinibacter ruber]MCS3785651.1 hypothetical protein [Salinibacter ruber]
MARFTSALLRLTTTDLWEIAPALKAAPKQKSNYRRIRRFLAEYEADFAALGRLLVHLLPQGPPHVVVIDRTEWHFGQTPVNVLTVGVGHDGMTIPVVWRALPSGGGSGQADHTDLLEQLPDVIDASSIKAVLADREFISAEWLRQMQRREIPFCIRLRSDRQIGDSEEGPTLPARMFARLPNSGTERVLEGERYLFGREGTPVPVRVVLRRIGSREAESPFLVLATWTVDPGEATRLYQRRWEIESMFAALKSRGFDLEATDLTDPRRVERPVGLLALAFSWTRLVGDRRAQKDAPNGQGLLQSKHTGAESGACSFCGLDRLQSILTTPEPQPQAFFKCLRVLRSPTAFLSCT